VGIRCVVYPTNLQIILELWSRPRNFTINFLEAQIKTNDQFRPPFPSFYIVKRENECFGRKTLKTLSIMCTTYISYSVVHNHNRNRNRQTSKQEQKRRRRDEVTFKGLRMEKGEYEEFSA